MKIGLDGFLLQEPFFKCGWTKYAFLNTIAPISGFSKIEKISYTIFSTWLISKVWLFRGLVICGRWNHGAEKKSSNAAVSIPLSSNLAQKVYLGHCSLSCAWRVCVITVGNCDRDPWWSWWSIMEAGAEAEVEAEALWHPLIYLSNPFLSPFKQMVKRKIKWSNRFKIPFL